MNKCQQCQQVVFDTELVIIEDLVTKIQPGDRLPSGGCPLCGGYCYPEGKDYDEAWLERFKNQLNQVSEGLKGIRELMIEVDAPTATFAMGGLLAQALRMYKEVMQAEMGLVLIDEPLIDAMRAQALANIPAASADDFPSAGSMDA